MNFIRNETGGVRFRYEAKRGLYTLPKVNSSIIKQQDSPQKQSCYREQACRPLRDRLALKDKQKRHRDKPVHRSGKVFHLLEGEAKKGKEKKIVVLTGMSFVKKKK